MHYIVVHSTASTIYTFWYLFANSLISFLKGGGTGGITPFLQFMSLQLKTRSFKKDKKSLTLLITNNLNTTTYSGYEINSNIEKMRLVQTACLSACVSICTVFNRIFKLEFRAFSFLTKLLKGVFWHRELSPMIKR